MLCEKMYVTIFLTLAYTPRPCSTALMMLAKLSSSRIMVAASRATSVPLRPMATPMSAFLSAGASFTPSPVTATIWPEALERAHDLHLVLGRDPREDHVLVLLQLRLEVVLGHLLEVDAGDDAHVLVAADDADAAGDGLGREPVVAGDHDDADAGAEGLVDRRAHFRPRRVDHADQAEEGQVGLDRVRRVVGELVRQAALADGEHAQRLARHGVVLRHDLLAALVGHGEDVAVHAQVRAAADGLRGRALDEGVLAVALDVHHATCACARSRTAARRSWAVR